MFPWGRWGFSDNLVQGGPVLLEAWRGSGYFFPSVFTCAARNQVLIKLLLLRIGKRKQKWCAQDTDVLGLFVVPMKMANKHGFFCRGHIIPVPKTIMWIDTLNCFNWKSWFHQHNSKYSWCYRSSNVWVNLSALQVLMVTGSRAPLISLMLLIKTWRFVSLCYTNMFYWNEIDTLEVLSNPTSFKILWLY